MKIKPGWIVLIVIVLIILIGGCSVKSGYNKLVNLETNVEQMWANVQSEYQRRSDLIPNLVNTVKGAANFEKSTLTQVIQARASATQVKIDPSNLSPAAIKKFQSSQGALTQALGRLMVVSERYPKLQATANFRGLQRQLEGTENRITTARIRFNRAVSAYNKKIRSFPTVMYAGSFGFEKKGMFKASKKAQSAPTVNFGSGNKSKQPQPQ